MASLNDIETRIQNIIDIIEGQVISTITGVLPLTFRANGSALIDYRIYGTADGAGVQTENLFDKDAQDKENGYVNASYLTPDNVLLSNNSFVVSEYISVEPNSDYYLSRVVLYGTSTGLCFYDENKTYISGIRLYTGGELTTNITTPNNCRYIRTSIQVSQSVCEESMIIKGSTPPETYIPYGYKLPLMLTSGVESKDTDIYIGDSKLLSSDYVDYERGKIIRNGTPQDPPRPFPEIDTYIGINTLDSVETLGEVTIKGKIKEVI